MNTSCACDARTHLHVEQDGSDPHGLAHFQVVGGQREAGGALVVGWQHLDVHGGDGAPGGGENKLAYSAERRKKMKANSCNFLWSKSKESGMES